MQRINNVFRHAFFTVVIFTSVLKAYSQDNKDKIVIYTLDYKIEGPCDYLNAHIDVPVFSGVFGGDHYGFSVGGQVSANVKSTIAVSGRISYNLSPYLTAGTNDFLNYIDHSVEQINTGKTQFTGVVKVNFSKKLSDAPVYEDIGYEGNTRYSVKTELPLLTTHGIRLGISRFANTSVFKKVIDLPLTNIDDNTVSYYTSESTLNGESINGWGVRLANPRLALRLGLEREKLTRYEFTIDNYEEFSFLKERNKTQRGGFIIKHYADILIGINKRTLKPFDVLYTEENDNDVILVSDEEIYDVTPQLTYLPVGISAGLELVTWAKRVSRTMFAEAGLAPGYGADLTNNLYGKFGVRLGLSKISY